MAGTPFLGIVIPTVRGREASLKRCIASYSRTLDGLGFPYVIRTERNHPTCGAAWNHGVDHLLTASLPNTPSTRRPNIIHLTADDIEAHDGWFDAGLARLHTHAIPAARILHGNGSLQSCGDEHERPEGYITEIARIPLFPAEIVPWLFPIPDAMHYYTDNVVSDRARLIDWPTVVTRDYLFTHHLAGEGRLDRLDEDHALWLESRR